MRQLTHILIFSLLLSPLAKVVAQEENYDAVYRSLTKEYTLNVDGTIDYRFTKQLKLQNYRSFHRLYGETFIVYNPDYQKLDINQAYTIMADGRKINAPENAFNKVLPRFAAHAPAFNQLREMVVTHTGLEVGSTIFLDYQIHTAKGFFPAFMGSTMLTEEQPVNSLTVVIRTPIDQPLFFHLFNSSLTPSETVEKGFRVYTWKAENIPAMESENLHPAYAETYPALIFSSLNNYQPLADFLTSQDAFNYKTNPVMDGFVAELAAENQQQTDLLFAIQESVVKDLNLIDIPEEYTGYRLRTPVEVWNANGGTVAEKAFLMTALLKKAGISAEPVLIIPKNQFDAKIGNLASLDEWAVKVEIPELGSTCLSVKQANAFDMMTLDPEGVFMALGPDKKFQLTYPEKKEATLTLNGIFVIDQEFHLSGELNGTLSGPAIPYLALVRSKDKLKHYLRGGLSSAKLSETTLSGLTPGETSFTCKISKTDALKQDAEMFYFNIPYLSTGTDSWNVGQLSAKRLTPVEPPSAIDESYSLTIAIPENLKLFSGEKDIRVKNKAGSFHFVVKAKGNVIQVQKEIKMDGETIGTGDYPAFKELMDNWSLWQTSNLIFTK
ncbi:DUF3857 domain-containing protein [Bacteroidota bacterium]